MPERVTVAVQGLNEFQRALKKLDADLPKGLRIALNGCADFLIDRVRPQIPQRTGNARRSLKARSTRTAVRIAVGGKVAPYYPWLDFGGTVGRGRKAAVKTGRGRRRTADQQARAGSVRRKFYQEGRYLYPTLRKNRAEFEGIMQAALVGVAEGAGLDVD